jgi:hypothetical protein
MPLLPDKPNPKPRSIAQPDAETRRCTKCLVRKPHDDFRWLWAGIRKSSHCKACERGLKTAPTKRFERPYSLGTLSRPRTAPHPGPERWIDPEVLAVFRRGIR